jgi:hypothetical protein
LAEKFKPDRCGFSLLRGGESVPGFVQVLVSDKFKNEPGLTGDRVGPTESR